MWKSLKSQKAEIRSLKKIEKRKQELFNFKKATLSLRDVVMKLEAIEIKGFNKKYFSELKEQINNLLTNIDFELQTHSKFF